MESPRKDIASEGPPTVLFAMEPRSYRDVIGSTVQQLRSHLLVVIADPSALRQEIELVKPVVVFANQPDMFPEGPEPCWVEFTPYDSYVMRVRLGRDSRELEDIGLDEILDLVDQSVDLINGRPRVSGTN